MTDIYFKCGCGKNLAVDAAGAGRKIACPDCGEMRVIPEASLEWRCPDCGAALLAPAAMDGERVQCLDCGSKVRIEGKRRPAEALEEAPAEDAVEPVGAPGGMPAEGMQKFFKHCPQCRERIPVSTVRCPFCDHAFGNKAPRGILVGGLCVLIVAGIALGLWQSEVWPFTSARPPPPPAALSAEPAPPPEAMAPAEPAAESNRLAAAPDAPAPAPPEVVETVQETPPEAPAPVPAFDLAEWLDQAARVRRFIGERLDKAQPRYAPQQPVALRRLDGLVLNGIHAGAQSNGIQLLVGEELRLVAFKDLDVHDRLRSDGDFRASWIEAQALALNRGVWERAGIRFPEVPAQDPDVPRQALELGDPSAQYQAGEAFLRRQDYAQAFLFMLAAARSHAPAQYVLGTMLWNGVGVAADRQQALKWMSLAAAQGHSKAGLFLQQSKLDDEARRQLVQQEQIRRDREAQALAEFMGAAGPPARPATAP